MSSFCYLTINITTEAELDQHQQPKNPAGKSNQGHAPLGDEADAQRATETVIADAMVAKALPELLVGRDAVVLPGLHHTAKSLDLQRVVAFSFAKALGLHAREFGLVLCKDADAVCTAISKHTDVQQAQRDKNTAAIFRAQKLSSEDNVPTTLVWDCIDSRLSDAQNTHARRRMQAFDKDTLRCAIVGAGTQSTMLESIFVGERGYREEQLNGRHHVLIGHTGCGAVQLELGRKITGDEEIEWLTARLKKNVLYLRERCPKATFSAAITHLSDPHGNAAGVKAIVPIEI